MSKQNINVNNIKTKEDVDNIVAASGAKDPAMKKRLYDFYISMIRDNPSLLLSDVITQYAKILSMGASGKNWADCFKLVKAIINNYDNYGSFETSLEMNDGVLTVSDIIDRGYISSTMTLNWLCAGSKLQMPELVYQAAWLGKSGILTSPCYWGESVEWELHMPDNYQDVIDDAVKESNRLYEYSESMDLHVEYGLYNPDVKVEPTKKKGDK